MSRKVQSISGLIFKWPDIQDPVAKQAIQEIIRDVGRVLGYHAEAINQIGAISESAALNFGAPSAVPGNVDLTIAVSGATPGDRATVSASIAIGTDYVLSAFVSAVDVVTVRWTQISGVAADPDGAGATYRVDVWKN